MAQKGKAETGLARLARAIGVWVRLCRIECGMGGTSSLLCRSTGSVVGGTVAPPIAKGLMAHGTAKRCRNRSHPRCNGLHLAPNPLRDAPSAPRIEAVRRIYCGEETRG